MLTFASKPCLALVAMMLLVFGMRTLVLPSVVNATTIGTCYTGEYAERKAAFNFLLTRSRVPMPNSPFGFR